MRSQRDPEKTPSRAPVGQQRRSIRSRRCSNPRRRIRRLPSAAITCIGGTRRLRTCRPPYVVRRAPDAQRSRATGRCRGSVLAASELRPLGTSRITGGRVSLRASPPRPPAASPSPTTRRPAVVRRPPRLEQGRSPARAGPRNYGARRRRLPAGVASGADLGSSAWNFRRVAEGEGVPPGRRCGSRSRTSPSLCCTAGRARRRAKATGGSMVQRSSRSCGAGRRAAGRERARSMISGSGRFPVLTGRTRSTRIWGRRCGGPASGHSNSHAGWCRDLKR